MDTKVLINIAKIFLTVTLGLIAMCILNSQELDFSDLVLKAHYPLSMDGTDVTGNYEPIELTEPIFTEGGVLSRDCYTFERNDTCTIITPNIVALRSRHYAIQIDFNVRSLSSGRPILSIGVKNRTLGLNFSNEGNLILQTNNETLDTIVDIVLVENKWYNATLTHDATDSITRVFIDSTLVFSKEAALNYREDIVLVAYEISSSNFGSGLSFPGYWRNLKVFSESESTTIYESTDPYQIHLYPNPVRNYLRVARPQFEFVEYSIYSMNGKLMQNALLRDQTIEVESLLPGVYQLILHSELNHTSKKFIKF